MKSRRYLSAGLDIGRQRGAIAIMAASMLTAVLLFTALAVDTGRLYLEKRNLQQQADIAALEAAQLYCSGFDSIATVEASIKAALLSSGFDADNAANSLTVGLGTLSSVSNMRV
ncbi:MAG: putative membrane protein, partial [Bacteroidia bacterium]